MSYDAHSDFGYSTIVAAPFPALTGVNLTVQAGQGALFPAVPFNCTVWPAGVQPLASNAEIVRVTAIVGDTFTITRAQEGTAAQPIAVGFQIANTTSVKVFTDIENSVIQFISAGVTKAGASEVVFADGNGISFGVAGQTVTASVAGAAQTTQPVAASASNGSFLFSTLAFANSNNVTFGTAPGQIIFASVAAQSTQPVAASASNGSFLFSTLKFANANNVTFGTSAGGVITASVAPGAADVVISANNGSFQSSLINFEGDGNITVQTAGGNMVSFHVDLQSVQPVAASASNGSFTFGTLGFSNANGVTFGTSAGSIVTASVGAGASPGSISAGANSIALGLVVFSNSNNVSFGLNGSTVTATVTNVQSTQPVAASASNGSFIFSTLGFNNANGVTFGTSAGGIVTASVATSAYGGLTFNSFQPVSFNNTTISHNLSASTGALSIHNFRLNGSMNLSFARNMIVFSTVATTTASQAVTTADARFSCFATYGVMLFTKGTGASSDSLYSVASGSAGYTFGIQMSISTASQYTNNYFITFQTGTVVGQTLSTSEALTSTGYRWNYGGLSNFIKGTKFNDIPISFAMTPGEYWIGFAFSSSSVTSNTQISQLTRNSMIPINDVLCPQIAMSTLLMGSSVGTIAELQAGAWVTNVFPTSSAINSTDISNLASNPRVWWDLYATA